MVTNVEEDKLVVAPVALRAAAAGDAGGLKPRCAGVSLWIYRDRKCVCWMCDLLRLLSAFGELCVHVLADSEQQALSTGNL